MPPVNKAVICCVSQPAANVNTWNASRHRYCETTVATPSKITDGYALWTLAICLSGDAFGGNIRSGVMPDSPQALSMRSYRNARRLIASLRLFGEVLYSFLDWNN